MDKNAPEKCRMVKIINTREFTGLNSFIRVCGNHFGLLSRI